MNGSDPLDALLGTPLTDIPDDGFSRRIANRIARSEHVSFGLELVAAALSLAVLACFFPANAVTQAGEAIVRELGNSVPFAIAVGVLLLCQNLSRMLTD
jgi:hypothetical protein